MLLSVWLKNPTGSNSTMKNTLLVSEAEHEARKLLTMLDLSQPPICPFQIARRHGIAVESKNTNKPGVSGILIKAGEQFGIMYATHIQNEGFIRFTVSHELGHYFIPGHPEHLFKEMNGTHHSRSGFVSNDPYELQADHFAKELLMPESMFREEIPKAGEGFEAIQHLSQKFNTSITATAIRYCTYAEHAVAGIMSSGKNVEWCFMSETLSEIPNIGWIKKGSLLPPRSYTLSFNKDAENISGSKKMEGWTNLSEWIDDAPDIEMKEDVIGLGSYSKTLTILFTDEAINP